MDRLVSGMAQQEHQAWGLSKLRESSVWLLFSVLLLTLLLTRGWPHAAPEVGLEQWSAVQPWSEEPLAQHKQRAAGGGGLFRAICGLQPVVAEQHPL